MVFKMINFLCPVASEQNSESCGTTTTQLNYRLGKNCKVPAKKRKASTILESPSKRPRCADGPTQVALDAVPAKRGKRKASAIRGPPEKKQKCGPSYANFNDAIRGTNWKEQDRAEKLPASVSPGMPNRERARDPSPGYSSPSASMENSSRTSFPITCDRARFEAKYQEFGILGQGGFGSVYAGRRKGDNLPVAIKHIPREDVDRQQVVLHRKTLMVPLEFLLMLKVGGGPASVGNSAAVSVLDWYDIDQEVLLVMERPAPCVNLLSYMEKNGGPLEEAVAKKIMKQVVDAALNMHTKGVFHRDIKAENLLVQTGSNDPRVRVIDFGCSCMVQQEPYSSFSGTSAYAPPEFFAHGRYEAAPTTVWQLGALLYEMLDGKQQFTTLKFIRRRINFNNYCSYDCQNFMKQCLAPSPKRRATLEQIKLHPWLQNLA